MSSGKTKNWHDKNPLHQTGLRQARSSSASNTGAYVFNLLLLDLGQRPWRPSSKRFACVCAALRSCVSTSFSRRASSSDCVADSRFSACFCAICGVRSRASSICFFTCNAGATAKHKVYAVLTTRWGATAYTNNLHGYNEGMFEQFWGAEQGHSSGPHVPTHNAEPHHKIVFQDDTPVADGASLHKCDHVMHGKLDILALPCVLWPATPSADLSFGLANVVVDVFVLAENVTTNITVKQRCTMSMCVNAVADLPLLISSERQDTSTHYTLYIHTRARSKQTAPPAHFVECSTT